MKISLNAKKITGAYGGGNQFANGLESYLTEQGHIVYRKLVPNLDLILIVSSKRHYQTTSYDIDAIYDYKEIYPNTIIVHRVNSCDEPRGRDLGINAAMLAVNQLADHTIFISTFVRELFTKHGMDMSKSHSTILNGGNANIFYPTESLPNTSNRKLRIVTHHWSTNYMKGFDIYERLGLLLNTEPFKEMFTFTYIGNIPLGLQFENCHIVPPVSGIELGNLLRQQDIYITAARHESAGMHHIEGMLCGLPVLFLNSGAIPEYCTPYGIEFTLVNFEQKLLEMSQQHTTLHEQVKKCPYTNEWMAMQYGKLFDQLLAERQKNPLSPPSLSKKLQAQWISGTSRKVKKLIDLGKKANTYLQA